jgi:RimJ/RimL family protein N-acetyltransferase
MILTTERMILRDFNEADWDAVYAYQRQPLYLRYYEWQERTPEAVREFIQMFIDQQQVQPRCKFQLAVTLKANGQLIGNCGIRKPFADDQEASIGYEFASDQWGQGYATEAAQAVLRFGFTELGVQRVWAECLAENVGSARVLEKIGMHQANRLRENTYFKDRWWDTLIYAIRYEEWQAQSIPVPCSDER